MWGRGVVESYFTLVDEDDIVATRLFGVEFGKYLLEFKQQVSTLSTGHTRTLETV